MLDLVSVRNWMTCSFTRHFSFLWRPLRTVSFCIMIKSSKKKINVFVNNSKTFLLISDMTQLRMLYPLSWPFVWAKPESVWLIAPLSQTPPPCFFPLPSFVSVLLNLVWFMQFYKAKWRCTVTQLLPLRLWFTVSFFTLLQPAPSFPVLLYSTHPPHHVAPSPSTLNVYQIRTLNVLHNEFCICTVYSNSACPSYDVVILEIVA